jgi:uncharacterized protein
VSVAEALALFAAAFFAGMVNSIAGGGTLLTFPVLLWTGLDSKIANATSTVALWPGSLGGAIGYRKELKEVRGLLLRLLLPSLLGGALGALFLRWTPTETFDRLVPFLILFATALFTAQGALARRATPEAGTPDRLRPRGEQDPTGPEPRPALKTRYWLFALPFQLAVSVYGGYFGAGLGILMLTGLGILGVADIHRANGLKNLLGACINGVAAASFILFGLVRWQEVLVMAAASIAGGYGAAGLARKIGRVWVRRIVITVGLLLGLKELWQTWLA